MDYKKLTEEDIRKAIEEENIKPSITKYSNGMYKIDPGPSEDGERRVSMYTFQGGYDLFCEALKKQAEKLDEEYEYVPCTCRCHSDPYTSHIVACCDNGFIKVPKTK